MFTLASSNECFLSVAYITASSSIYIDGVVAARGQASCPADCVVTSSFRIAINNGITTIKLAEVLLLQTPLRWQRQTNQHTITQQSNRDDEKRVAPPDGG